MLWIEWWPLKRYVYALSSEMCQWNHTWRGVLTDVITLGISRQDHPRLTRKALNSMTIVLLRDIWRSSPPCLYQISTSQGMFRATRSQKRQRICHYRVFRRSMALWTLWFSTSDLQNCELIHFSWGNLL